VVLFLAAAYRSLGGAQPRATDSAVLLRSLHAQLTASLATLTVELEARAHQGRPSDHSGAGRKVSATVQQTLDRLPPPPRAPDARDATVRSLLAAAAEDTAWAWRMLEAPVFSPAVAAAAAVLAHHAAECCDQAGPLLTVPAPREPSDGP
jgi:hypothetical protein